MNGPQPTHLTRLRRSYIAKDATQQTPAEAALDEYVEKIKAVYDQARKTNSRMPAWPGIDSYGQAVWSLLSMYVSVMRWS